MDDLIKRQDAIGKIKDWMKFLGYSHGERNVMECTIQMLEELPSAQPLNDDWEKYSDLEFSEPYYTDIQVLSQLRSMYNCFDPKEEPIYHALSMAIEALQAQATLDDVSNAYENGYQQGKFEATQKTGKWLEKNRVYSEESHIDDWQSCCCSVCGHYDTRPYMYYFDEPNYCSYCGARMECKGE